MLGAHMGWIRAWVAGPVVLIAGLLAWGGQAEAHESTRELHEMGWVVEGTWTVDASSHTIDGDSQDRYVTTFTTNPENSAIEWDQSFESVASRVTGCLSYNDAILRSESSGTGHGSDEIDPGHPYDGYQPALFGYDDNLISPFIIDLLDDDDLLSYHWSHRYISEAPNCPESQEAMASSALTTATPRRSPCSCPIPRRSCTRCRSARCWRSSTAVPLWTTPSTTCAGR